MTPIPPKTEGKQPIRPLKRGTPLPLRKGIERLNQKYAKTLEKLAK